MKINLHIERLVLDGVDIESHQKNELKAAVEIELRQQLANQGIGSTIQSSYSRQSVRETPILIENICKPARLGQQIGNAVYRGLGK